MDDNFKMADTECRRLSMAEGIRDSNIIVMDFLTILQRFNIIDEAQTLQLIDKWVW